MKLTKVYLSLLMTAISFTGFAQFRKYSNEFLNIGAGARALAMGSAQVASVSDGTAGYWNPAGLVGVKDHPNLNLMHSEYFAGIGKYDYASIAFPTSNNRSVLAVSALRFAVDDIANTLFLVEPDGSANYNNITEFSAADYGFIFSYAQKMKQKGNNNFHFGVNAKVIHRSVGHFAKAWGFGLDGGVQLITKKWKFGAMGRDITTTFNTWSFTFSENEKIALARTENVIPTKSTELTAPRLVLAAARDFRIGKKMTLLAEADLDVTFDGKRNTVVSADPVSIDPKVGIELDVHNIFYIRAGIKNFQRTLDDADSTNQKKVWIYQPSAGAGFNISNFTIDYAFTNLANQSNPLFTHVFSIKLNMVGDKSKKKN